MSIRQRRQRQRQRVTEGTAMAPWNGPNNTETHRQERNRDRELNISKCDGFFVELEQIRSAAGGWERESDRIERSDKR